MSTTSSPLSTHPAEERLRDVGGRTLLVVLLVALITVLLCNVGAWWLVKTFPANRGYAVAQGKWRLLDRLQGPVDTLIVGDSSCHLGINPQLIEERMGGTALNLCTTGTFALLDGYWILERHIQRHGPPGMLIVGHVYHIWRRSLSGVALAKIPLGGLSSFRHWAPLNIKLADRFDFLLTKYAPLYADNISVAVNLLRPWRMGRRDFSLPAGGYVGLKEADSERVRQEMKSHLKWVRKERFKITPENRFALDKMVALGREHGFEIYVVNAPMYEGLFEDAEIQAYVAELKAFFQDYAVQNPHVHHIFAEPLLFPDTVMENIDHVTMPAADVYTRKLIESIEALRAVRRE